MAVMIPGSGPKEHSAESREGSLYHALAKLPDDFYVVHLFDLLTTADGVARENEANFVVFNRSLGILCIETKAGHACCVDGEWHYGNSLAMKHGNPFKQTDNMKYGILDRIRETLSGRASWCRKALHAVWFPSLRWQDFQTNPPPPEADANKPSTSKDPGPRIRDIFSLEVGDVCADLSEDEADTIVSRVPCLEFKVIPTERHRYDPADTAFVRLPDSQARVLDFIADRRTVTINSDADTDKTLVAVERTRRAAAQCARAPFLCFNKLLRDIANKLSGVSVVDVRTIAAYACSVCASPSPNYELLGNRLLEHCETDDFPYDHVTVDEEQDFGIAEINSVGILDLHLEAVLTRARTSYPPLLFVSEFVDGQIAMLRDAGIDDTVILTRKTEESSIFSANFCGKKDRRMWMRTGVRVSTCRKFKGLEADAAILVDVNESLWREPERDYESDPDQLFYTGASRAKHELRIVCNMGEEEYLTVLKSLGFNSKKKPITRLAKQLNAVNVSERSA